MPTRIAPPPAAGRLIVSPVALWGVLRGGANASETSRNTRSAAPALSADQSEFMWIVLAWVHGWWHRQEPVRAAMGLFLRQAHPFPALPPQSFVLRRRAARLAPIHAPPPPLLTSRLAARLAF